MIMVSNKVRKSHIISVYKCMNTNEYFCKYCNLLPCIDLMTTILFLSRTINTSVFTENFRD